MSAFHKAHYATLPAQSLCMHCGAPCCAQGWCRCQHSAQQQHDQHLSTRLRVYNHVDHIEGTRGPTHPRRAALEQRIASPSLAAALTLAQASCSFTAESAATTRYSGCVTGSRDKKISHAQLVSLLAIKRSVGSIKPLVEAQTGLASIASLFSAHVASAASVPHPTLLLLAAARADSHLLRRRQARRQGSGAPRHPYSFHF